MPAKGKKYKSYALDKAVSQLPLIQARNKKPDELKQLLGFEVPTNFAEFASSCFIKSGTEYIPFNLYDYQIELNKIFDNHRRIIGFKTRQLGYSEVVGCKMLHRAMLKKAYSGVVISIGQDESSKISERVQNMPNFPNFRWEYQSAKRVKPVGGGNIYFRPSTDNAARSLPSVVDLFLDEADFIRNPSSILASASPTQKMSGDDAKTYVVSTMGEDGEIGWFWELFSGANPPEIDLEEKIAHIREGKGECGAGLTYWVDNSGWAKVLLHWKSHPIYSQVPDFLEKTKREEKLTQDQLEREYNLSVPKSGSTLFNTASIDRQAIGEWQVDRKWDWLPGLYPKQINRQYLAGIDPNFGSADYFRCCIWDISSYPYSLAAEYAEQNRSVTDYSIPKVIELLDKFQPVITAVEANSGGKIVLEEFIKRRPQLRFESVITSRPSKVANTDRIAIAVENGDVVYPIDWDGVNEMKKFSIKDRCARNGHDDCIMSWSAAFCYLEEALTYVNARDWLNAV